MTATPTVGSTFFGLDISQFVARLMSIRRKISKRVLLLEFRADSLLLAEATLTQLGVQLGHISSFPLPPEALDRGVPAEPLKMAGLIQDFCSEKKIPAHRVAVVLPPELAFQRLLDLPDSLTTDEAREYVLNPSNGLQIPFPLTQTDFDLFPVLMPIEQHGGDKRTYMLTAIPEILVDPIVEMLQAADLELQLLELGSHSQLRNYAAELITLAPQQVDLVLELLPDCCNLMLVSCSGLLGSERLASVRNVPELSLKDDQLAVAMSSGISAEDLVFKDESYLPLSDLDLRVLVADFRASLERFHLKWPGAEIRRVIVTGVNSSHPLLADLLAETLSVPVVLSRSTAITGLDGLSMDDLLLQSSLGRLTGLALGLLSNDQLLACSLEGHAADGQESQHQNDGVAFADLLSSSQAQTGLDLYAMEASPVDVFAEETNIDQSVYTIATPVEDVSDPELDVEHKPYAVTDIADQSHRLPASEQLNADQLDAPISLSMEPTLIDESSESVVDIHSSDALSQDEWPSIKNVTDEVSDEFSAVLESDGPDSLSVDREPSFSLESSPKEEAGSRPETLWPSITSAKPVEAKFSKSDELESPLISSYPMQDSITASIPSDNPESLIQINQNISQVTDVELELTLNNSSGQPDVIEQSNAEDSVSEMLPTELTLDAASNAVIPNLSLMPSDDECNEKPDPQLSKMEDSDSSGVSKELGQLRFAEED